MNNILVACFLTHSVVMHWRRIPTFDMLGPSWDQCRFP